MTATGTAPASSRAQDAGRGAVGPAGLLRAELRRAASRRFLRVVVLLAVVGYAVVLAVAATQFARPTPAALAEAEQRLAEAVAESEQFREQCLADGVPEGEDPEAFCGPPADEQGFELSWFLDRQPFVLASELPGGAVGIGIATAAVMFVVGATLVGAEWSTRSIVALLFWEPRRLRVMAAKTAVVALLAFVTAVVTQAVWLAAAVLLARYRGTDDVDDGFWGEVVAQQARCVLLVVLVSLLGFGLAHLLRNTGAALGVGFAYFAVAETAVRILWPRGQAALVSDNALALVTTGGWRVFVPGNDVGPDGQLVDAGREIMLTNATGGLVLLGYVALLLAVGTWSFRRRDLH